MIKAEIKDKMREWFTKTPKSPRYCYLNLEAYEDLRIEVARTLREEFDPDSVITKIYGMIIKLHDGDIELLYN